MVIKTKKKAVAVRQNSHIMIMAESTVLEDIGIGKIDRQCKYFKSKAPTDHKIEGTDQTLQNAIDNEEPIIFTNKST